MLFCMALQFVNVVLCSAQKSSSDSIVERDSLLFYTQRLNIYVRPMLAFDIGMACDEFLKEKKEADYWFRNSHVFIKDLDDELSNYRMFGMDFYHSENRNLKMQDDWDYYKKILLGAYKLSHSVGYDEETEKAHLIERLKAFGDSAVFKPLFYRTIKEKYQNNVRAYVNDLYKTSFMSNKKRLKRFVLNPKRRRLNEDLVAQMSMAVELYKYWLDNRQRIDNCFIGRFVYQAEETE